MQAPQADQPDHYRHRQDRQRNFQIARHYFAPAGAAEFAGVEPTGRNIWTPRTIAAASGAPMASKILGSPTETLESSTAAAGAATERSSRTAKRVDIAGDPLNLCANCACSASARR